MEARADDDLDPAAGHAVDGPSVSRRVSRDRRRVLLPRRRAGRRRADLGAASRRAAGTTSPTSPARRRCASGTTPSARTPGGSRSSSTTRATPRSTTRARPNRRSSSCACTSRSATRSTSRRSTRRSSSSSTASIRSAPGRSAFRCSTSSRMHGMPDYTSFPTFNDDVAAENIDFLLMCYQALGDRARCSIRSSRGMNAFIVTQHGPPQPGWGLQHTLDLKPVGRAHLRAEGARDAHHGDQHRAADALLPADRRHEVPGAHSRGARLAREADAAAGRRAAGGRTHPTFVELGTNKPLYVHRDGSNVVNGRYYVDYDPKSTLGHYSSFRRSTSPGLRKQYEAAQAMPPDEAAKDSPLSAGAGVVPLPRFFVAAAAADAAPAARDRRVAQRAGLLAGAARLQQPSVQGRDGTTRRARRFLADARRRRHRYVAVSRSEADGHFDRGLHPQHGRADSRRSAMPTKRP